MAGGEGKRLLPLTRKITGDDRPKQFCALSDGEELLELTRCRHYCGSITCSSNPDSNSLAAAIDLPPAAIDIILAAATMEKSRSKCYDLDRIAGARKDARGWPATVSRMRALPDSGISEADSRIIVSYLASQLEPKGQWAQHERSWTSGAGHTLDRVYKTAETPGEWSATVTRMVSYAAGSSGAFQPGEDQQIIAYLSATQTPDAVDQRKARAAEASSAGRSMVTQKVSAAPDQPMPRSGYDSKMIGFVSLVSLGLLILIIRRPD